MVRMVEFRPDAPPEFLHDRGDLGDLLIGAVGEESFDAGGAFLRSCLEGLVEGLSQLWPEGTQAPLHFFGGLRIKLCGEGISNLCDVEPAEAAFPDDAAGGENLLVQPLAVAADQNEAGVGNDRRGFESVVGDDASGDAVYLLGAGR